jgi:hypothetical protein
MPTKALTIRTLQNRQILINYINRAKAPVPVYYENYYFKTQCDDPTKLIGVFGPGTTIEELKYEADIGGTMRRRKTGKIATKVRKLTEQSNDRNVINILTEAARKIESLK